MERYSLSADFYLIRSDGTSVFSLPYCYDFLIHCLISLVNRDIDTSGYRIISSYTYTVFSQEVAQRPHNNSHNFKSGMMW